MAARHRAADAAGDSEFESLSASLGQARQSLAALVIRGKGASTTDAYASQLKQAGEEKEEAERKLAAHSARFREQLTGSRAGLEQVSAALPAGSVMVSYAQLHPLGILVERSEFESE